MATQEQYDLDTYLKRAETWNEEAYRKIKASRTRAWYVAGLGLLMALVSMLCVLVMLPLQSVETVPVLVNQNTGEVRVMQSLSDRVITPNEAITEANLVQYVIARETFDADDVARLYQRVAVNSTAKALQPFKRAFNSDGPDNPFNKYGRTSTRTVQVKSVSRLNENTGQVRFRTDYQSTAGEREDHWIATIRFRYVNQPQQLIDRVENPLGFQVTEYRVDQEIIEVGK